MQSYRKCAVADYTVRFMAVLSFAHVRNAFEKVSKVVLPSQETPSRPVFFYPHSDRTEITLGGK